MENKKQEQNQYDTAIIRPQLRIEDIKLRGQDVLWAKLKSTRRYLVTFHTLEIMAVNIYKFQITPEPTELNHQLIMAMGNEMTHFQDFQIRLYEYGGKPGKMRWMFWLVGIFFGLSSRFMGRRWILKINAWAEAKAIAHYDHLLKTVDWDDDTRKMIEKDRADEYSHFTRWKKLLENE